MAGQATVVSEPSSASETSEHSSAVAVYDSHSDAEQAIRTLAKSGFDMQKLSIVGRDYSTEEGVVGYYNAGERMKAWGKAGAFWGGLWGMLFGSALFFVPGIGPLFVAGPLVAWIVGALEGATVVGGMSALGAGLLQHRDSQGQRPDVRDRDQGRQVRGDRPRHASRGGQEQDDSPRGRASRREDATLLRMTPVPCDSRG